MLLIYNINSFLAQVLLPPTLFASWWQLTECDRGKNAKMFELQRWVNLGNK